MHQPRCNCCDGRPHLLPEGSWCTWECLDCGHQWDAPIPAGWGEERNVSDSELETPTSIRGGGS